MKKSNIDFLLSSSKYDVISSIITTGFSFLFFFIISISESFKENTIYIKGYNSAVKHYIFTNKIKLIEKILENLEIKFEIVDIKIK